jgi:hypothetical protein
MTSVPPPHQPVDMSAYDMKPPPIDYGKPTSFTGLLWCAYVLSALCPVAGLGFAAYIHVADKNAPIRRHAVGVLAVAAIAFVVYILIIAHSTASQTVTTTYYTYPAY